VVAALRPAGRWNALVLLDKGHLQFETMGKMRIREEDIMAMARERGLERPEQIEYGVLERNGEISIIPAREDE
jgi:uncharacterized membrane protein YcaP (DUF421 family)